LNFFISVLMISTAGASEFMPLRLQWALMMNAPGYDEWRSAWALVQRVRQQDSAHHIPGFDNEFLIPFIRVTRQRRPGLDDATLSGSLAALNRFLDLSPFMREETQSRRIAYEVLLPIARSLGPNFQAVGKDLHVLLKDHWIDLLASDPSSIETLLKMADVVGADKPGQAAETVFNLFGQAALDGPDSVDTSERLVPMVEAVVDIREGPMHPLVPILGLTGYKENFLTDMKHILGILPRWGVELKGQEILRHAQTQKLNEAHLAELIMIATEQGIPDISEKAWIMLRPALQYLNPAILQSYESLLHTNNNNHWNGKLAESA